jgi:hypothetical protein
MTATTIRLFEQPNICTFQLSPLYAEPGWYGAADSVGTVGPYPSREQVRQYLEALAEDRTEGRPES